MVALVVFIRRSAGRSGATKVQIAERRAGRNVILEHIGTAHDEAELAVLMQIARERIRPGQEALDLGLDDAPAGTGRARGVITSKRCALLWDVLTSAYARLGFDVLGDDAFMQLVLARLVEPTSKADSVRVLEEIGVPHVDVRTFFRALDRAVHRDYRGQIAAACFAHAARHGDLTLVLYDVTTLYFEAEYEDELRKVGYSKERRVDPQVVVGLLVDRGGFPLEITCWEGNKAETATILPTIRAFQERHGVADMVVVADAGMLSSSNLKALDEANVRFIVGSRQTKAPADLASHFRWHGDAFTDGQIIDTITPRHAGATSENDTHLRDEPVWAPQTHPKSWRAVWAYSSKRSARDNKTLTAQENRARAVVAGERPARKPRFVMITGDAAVLNEKDLARGSQPGRVEGLCHQHPRRRDARERGHRQLPRPVAGRAVVPDVEVRPAGAADISSRARRDRSPPDRRRHRAGRRPSPTRTHRPQPEEDHPGLTAPAGDHAHHRRPRTPRRRPPHPSRETHPEVHRPPAGKMTYPGVMTRV